MPRPELVHQYSPPWAEHVKGRYSERTVDGDGIPEEQHVHAKCEQCGAEFKRVCSSGMVRNHIVNFAINHLHRDPLATPPTMKPR